MSLAAVFRSVVVFSITVASLVAAPAPKPIRVFDSMGDVKCEFEMARLDNFAIQILNEPSSRGVIIFYGGRLFRGRLPRRNEAAARAARMKPYLIERRGIPADRIVVIDGGYRLQWEAEFWIVPEGMTIPTPFSTVDVTKIKFRKGKAHPRQFRCNI